MEERDDAGGRPHTGWLSDVAQLISEVSLVRAQVVFTDKWNAPENGPIIFAPVRCADLEVANLNLFFSKQFEIA